MSENKEEGERVGGVWVVGEVDLRMRRARGRAESVWVGEVECVGD